MSNGISPCGGRMFGYFTQTPPKGSPLFGYCDLQEFDLYWICYECETLDKDKRKQLKDLGWRLQRHSRSNCEMWVFDKPEAHALFAKQKAEKEVRRETKSSKHKAST